jgi:hypothetical protein
VRRSLLQQPEIKGRAFMKVEQNDDRLAGFDVSKACGILGYYFQCTFNIGKSPVAGEFFRRGVNGTDGGKMN